MIKVITLGETMAAMIPGASGPLRYVADYSVRTAGAESNVAIGLAKLDVEAAWVSRLGSDEIGHYIMNQIRGEGVNCRGVVIDKDHRTGVMFKEIGAGETKVFYYRENSAASHMMPEDLQTEMFDEAEIFYFSGITPVLSDDCRRTSDHALEMASDRGMKIAFDPNIRKKLWKGNDYTSLIREYALKSNIVMLGLDEAKVIFGTDDPDQVFERLFSEGKAEYAAIKRGGDGAVAADRNGRYDIPPYKCICIEPIGAGDGFNAGFMAGLIAGKNVEEAGRMGAVAGALATQTTGDIEGYPDKEQMKAAMENAEITFR